MRMVKTFVILALGAGMFAAPAIAGDNTASKTAVAAGATADPMDQVVCKSSLETGSLVRQTKRCYTRRQWNKLGESARRGGRNLQENGTGRPADVGD